MNYPVWEAPFPGGSTLIALISILHVFVAHLAVGGGLFLWLMDRRSFRDGDAELEGYLRVHSRFFLLLTMVFGAVTGVGLWFILGLVNPEGTAALIHTFAFVWAMEWACFLGEIAALLIYHYRFDAMDRRGRMRIALAYFIFAWLSLFLVNGILSFMLTPGKWLVTRSLSDAFFNPSFAPSTMMRSFAAFMLAGLFGCVTAAFGTEGAFRTRMLRHCTSWLLYPLAGIMLSLLWYYHSLPEGVRYTAFVVNPDTAAFRIVLMAASAYIFITGVLLSRSADPRVQKAAASALVIIGLMWMGGFEYLREAARRPYTVRGHLYSNSLFRDDTDRLSEEGMLASARWVPDPLTLGTAETGREIFLIQCAGCHTVGGPRNDILSRTAGFTFTGMIAHLTGQGKIRAYMPPFVGTREEKAALAEYIVGTLQRKKIDTLMESRSIKQLPDEPVPAFNPYTDDWVLLAWTGYGMHMISDCDEYFSLIPPASTVEAMLIRRGKSPSMAGGDVRLEYGLEPGHENPSAYTKFWDYAGSLYGRPIAKNTGPTGMGSSGVLAFNPRTAIHSAQEIPLLPYGPVTAFNPYPLVSVRAIEAGTKRQLAATRLAAPVSTEMGCRNCHDGAWRRDGSGISGDTARNILRAHDRSNSTTLLKSAGAGRPRACQGCHADASTGAKGDGKRLSLSAAMHGFHAPYMPSQEEDACWMCHPSHPQGASRMLRGVHRDAGITCVSCHGAMSDHALSLVSGERSKRAARHLYGAMHPVDADREDILPRAAWLNMPDCLACHVNFKKPGESPTAFNKWNIDPSERYGLRTDNMGVRCVACHNTAHAEHPARNPYNRGRDSIQPLQYMRTPWPIGANRSCPVCHRENKYESAHHDNMLRPPRRITGY